MNKNKIGAKILQDKEKIIARYKTDDDILNIAYDYNVKGDTLCHRLKAWGLKIKKGDYQKQGKLDQTKKVKYTLKKSPELLAKMRKNTEIKFTTAKRRYYDMKKKHGAQVQMYDKTEKLIPSKFGEIIGSI